MKAVYIDHYDSFAQMIMAYMENAGCTVKMFKSDCDIKTVEKEDPDLILLGPGPNGPQQAGNYLKVIGHFHKKIPMFGICLGFQAIMHYFGAKVEPLDEVIHGSGSKITHDDKTIFEGLPEEISFARYHSLGTHSVPDDFEVSARCGDVIMAARHKGLPIEGIQFHPESILSMRKDAGDKIIQNMVRHYESYIDKTAP
jgi:anthranilate synthase/aminodeoxychorismate synthase-like glutamine amidotransferase